MKCTFQIASNKLKALIRLLECAGCTAPLLVACNKSGFSWDEARMVHEHVQDARKHILGFYIITLDNI